MRWGWSQELYWVLFGFSGATYCKRLLTWNSYEGTYFIQGITM